MELFGSRKVKDFSCTELFRDITPSSYRISTGLNTHELIRENQLLLLLTVVLQMISTLNQFLIQTIPYLNWPIFNPEL